MALAHRVGMLPRGPVRSMWWHQVVRKITGNKPRPAGNKPTPARRHAGLRQTGPEE